MSRSILVTGALETNLKKVKIISYRRRSFSTREGFQHGTPSGQLQATDLLDVYRGLVAQGRLKYDEEQIRVIMELRRLHKQLVAYAPPAFVSSTLYSTDEATSNSNAWWLPIGDSEMVPAAAENKSLVRLKSHAEEIASLNTPKGLFLTGAPGCGKSMLIDLWFSIIPTPYKTRKHYSTLVLEIYRGVWEETKRRQALPPSQTVQPTSWNKVIRDRWRALFASGDFPSFKRQGTVPTASPFLPSISYNIARRLLLRHWLLVFDEIQLLDVSSAGLLSDVLSWYWRMGGVVVGSSNKVPDDLYRNGVQRERLEPFVEALKLRCPVVHIRNTNDYRRIKAANGTGRTWFLRGQEQQFEQTLAQLTTVKQMEYDTFEVFGRPVPVRRISDKTCFFTFEELCDRSLGPADYSSIASRYSTVILKYVPIFGLNSKNQGRRFISLIDALYEARCRLICLSEADIDHLFFPNKSGSLYEDTNDSVMMAESISEAKETYRPNTSVYEPIASLPNISFQSFDMDSLSIFSGDEERFAYQRAQSRLLEMTSTDYQQDQWQPLPSKLRQWETSSSRAKEPPVSPSLEAEVISDDFAAEAAYDYLSHRVQERLPAPIIKEHHFWGVREDWGPQAKAWGKGARVYDKSREDP